MQSGADGIESRKGEQVQGLAGWVLDLIRSRRGGNAGRQRQLQILETLPLGGKRQLMLVSCNGEHFLVGGGAESVSTIVRVSSDGLPELAAKDRNERCQ